MARPGIACTTFPFTGLPLRQAFDRIAELGFARAEMVVHHEPEWGHLTPAGILRDPLLALELVEEAQRQSGVRLAAMIVSTEPYILAERGEFEAACKLARRAGAGVVTIRGTARDEVLEIRRLRDFTAVAMEQGLTACLETRSDTPFGVPAAAAAVAEHIQGLRITLDTGHLLCRGHGPATWGPLLPHVSHVHLRDAGGDDAHFQVPFGSGLLDVDRLLRDLHAANYEGLLTAEYIGRRPEDAVTFEPDPELRRVREYLERALGKTAN